MRYSEPDAPRTEESSVEEQLRRENEELRRQLQHLRAPHPATTGVPANLWAPSRLTILALIFGVLLILVIAFFAGYLPLHRRTTVIADEAQARETALPRVEVITVGRSTRDGALRLPGNIQAIAEAPILARADGYLKQRLVDLGDRVRSGQTLAVIEAPELDEQVQQARASLQQARAAMAQAEANLQQGRSELELARVTAKRFANLVGDGSVSAQENDQYQAQYQSKIASVHSLEQALAVQRSGIAAAEANAARLENMKRYRVVVAPFAGVITLRNVDAGALVNNGSTLLFRIAQADIVRTYLNVPQSHAGSVHPGDVAVLTVSNLPGKSFEGKVARTANALDPASRTLLVEVHVPNKQGLLLPGMYAQVELSSLRKNPPLLIPSTALIVSGAGTRVAVVDEAHQVHLQAIVPGRDYGDQIEVNSGLSLGDTIIASPSDVMQDGTKVEPVTAMPPATSSTN